jgi:protein TonB
MARSIALSSAAVASMPGHSVAPDRGIGTLARPSFDRAAGGWDDLTPRQRRGVVAAMVLLHAGAAAWLVLQPAHAPLPVLPPPTLRVEWIAAPAPVVEPSRPVEPAPMPLKPVPPRPVTAPPERLIAAPESAAPAAVVTPPPAPLPAVDSPAAPPEPAAPPAPASPVAPKTLPPEAVQYLLPPAPVYPKWSRRQGESGRVLVKVYVDEGGLPRSVQVVESSGHPRLDEAARAAVQAARFKPYAENGRPTAGWAFVPLTFDLEK